MMTFSLVVLAVQHSLLLAAREGSQNLKWTLFLKVALAG